MEHCDVSGALLSQLGLSCSCPLRFLCLVVIPLYSNRRRKILRMDSSLASLPNAFLRRTTLSTGAETSVQESDRPPLTEGHPASNSGDTTNGEGNGTRGSIWGSRNTQHQNSSAGGVAQERSMQAKSQPILGRTVGPFGNGTGAAGRLSSSSGLFGNAEKSPTNSSARTTDRWRTTTGQGISSLQARQQSRDSRGMTDWMPVLEVGASKRHEGARRETTQSTPPASGDALVPPQHTLASNGMYLNEGSFLEGSSRWLDVPEPLGRGPMVTMPSTTPIVQHEDDLDRGVASGRPAAGSDVTAHASRIVLPGSSTYPHAPLDGLRKTAPTSIRSHSLDDSSGEEDENPFA